MGIVPLAKALQIASEANLDLVEVSPNSEPSVCRLLDYGKYRYEQTKKERKGRQSQRASLLKEIRLRPRSKEHDLETKINTARKLLNKGDKVRAFVIFRGREISHPELGVNMLQKVTDDLKDVAVLDSAPSLTGRIMSMVFSPISTKQPKDQKEPEEKERDKEKI